MRLSLSSGLRLVLKCSSLFRAVCSLFSNALVQFEQFAPCSQIPYSLFRAVGSLFSKFSPIFGFAPCFQIRYSLSSGLLPFSKSPVCALFSNSLVSFERFAPCSPILHSLSSALLPVLQFPRPLRAVCALFSNYI